MPPSKKRANAARKALHARTDDGRIKGKAIVLTTLREPEPLMVAADRAGVHRTTVRRWQQQDPEFDAQVKDAVLDGADVLISLLFAEARSGNRQAIMDALRVMGILEGANANKRDLEPNIMATKSIEELAARAIERGYVSHPEPLVEIDGEELVEVR